MGRSRWALAGALVGGPLWLLVGCQTPAPATEASPGATSGAAAATTAPAPTQALGIDFRVPPTRAPSRPSASPAPAVGPFAVASPSATVGR